MPLIDYQLMNEKEAFRRLRKGDLSVLENIYQKNRKLCISFATKNLFRTVLQGSTKNCTEEEALELYHDAIIVMVENIQENRLTELRSKFSTYLIATMKNKWLGQLKKVTPIFPGDDLLRERLGEEEKEFSESKRWVRLSLSRLDPRCREMLTLWHMMNWEYEDIATTLGYKQGDVVRNVISRCRKKFREIYVSVKENALQA